VGDGSHAFWRRTRRLQLLLVLAERPNVLLLDEPTNDLDLDTLRCLEDFLEDWPGALVVVSHDRAFLERSVVDLLALDGRGGTAPVAGGVPAWVAAATAGALGSAGSGGRGAMAGRSALGHSSTGSRLPAGPASSRSGTGRRSPSTLRRLLLDSERQLKQLERRRGHLVGLMAGSSADHEALARIGSALAALQGEMDEIEDRWLALAEEAEEA